MLSKKVPMSLKSMFVLMPVLYIILFTVIAEARIHHLEVRHDTRPYIALSTFGFYTNGHLNVHLQNLEINGDLQSGLFGLSLDKTTIDQMNPYLDSHQNKCILEEKLDLQHSGPIAFLIMNFKSLTVQVFCSPDWKNIHIYNLNDVPSRSKRYSDLSDSSLMIQSRKRRAIDNATFNSTPKALADISDDLGKDTNKEENEKMTEKTPFVMVSPNTIFGIPVPTQICSKLFTLPIKKNVINNKVYYNMSFAMNVLTQHDEGLYNLYFHACPNYRKRIPISFDVDIEENNNGNFLSAGEMPLPALYFMMSLLFFLSGLFWVYILKKSKHNVYKIHYIMAILVFLKSLSLMFHSINYHFIERLGEHVETWAILYYIAHLLKGAVLFITIVLIGTGWTFIKHILSDKDKKIFMIVIPLQVLANVAKIIIDESEESDIEFRTWRNIFIFVDLLCCGAILFPIVWSIRHLHEASATDGKAAINLRKLKLFRQFYIMIVCYIYFTRIIVYLLKMTVAFQYAWLDEMFHEMATYVFFVLTGYKFRPASSNPYLTVPDEDLDDDEVEILTESGLTEGLHRTKAQNRNAAPTTVIIEGNDEERENLITKRESSHEYD